MRKLTSNEEIAEEVALRHRTTQMKGYQPVGWQQSIIEDEVIVVLANNTRRIARRHSIIVRVNTKDREIIEYKRMS